MSLPIIIEQIRGLDSQQEFAEKLGCTRAAVSYWENGKHRPAFPYVLRMLELATPEQKEALAEEFALRAILQTLIIHLGVRA